MFCRVLSLSLVSCAVLWAVTARADDLAPVTQADFRKLIDKIDRLQQQVDSLKPPAAALAPAGSSAIPAPPALAAPAEVAAGGNSSLDLSANSNAGSAAQIANLDRRVKTLENRYYDQALMNTQIQQWVSDVGGPTLQAKGDSPATAPKGGELRIHNQMSTEQRVVINGVDVYSVAPSSTRIIKVPVGTSTTQITGEAPVSWFIGPQNYNQDIIIAPARNPLNPQRVVFDPYSQSWMVVNAQ